MSVFTRKSIIKNMKIGYLITCEHASNKIPSKYKSVFAPHAKLLETHRGWDIGAYQCYQAIIKTIACQSQYAKWSRLLIELNRSLHHRSLFCEITKTLDIDARNQIIHDIYVPYREAIHQKIKQLLSKHDRIIHISVHSFTPKMNNEVRNAEVGLLYDPKRPYERDFCFRLKHHIKCENENLRVRMNYPYLGSSDGLTTALRKIYAEKSYIGLELELNQKLMLDKNKQHAFIQNIVHALQKTIHIVTADEFSSRRQASSNRSLHRSK